jgi:hypothetical protein
MYVITFKNSTSIKVNDPIAQDVDARWGKRVATKDTIIIPVAGTGQKVTVSLTSINGIYPEEIWDSMLHERNGDWLCAQGQWHKKGYSCAHEPPKVPYAEKGQTILDRIDKPPSGKLSDRHWDVMRRNMAIMKQTGHYGSEGLSEDDINRRAALRAKVESQRMKFKPLSSEYRRIQKRVLEAANPGDES